MSNFFDKHRLHHNGKTHRIWTSTPVAEQGLEWTTLTGRSYTTHPKDWREGLGPPGSDGPPSQPGSGPARNPYRGQGDPSGPGETEGGDPAVDPPPF